MDKSCCSYDKRDFWFLLLRHKKALEAYEETLKKFYDDMNENFVNVRHEEREDS